MKKAFPTLAISTLALLAQPASACLVSGAEKQALFESFDKDGNDKLTLEEYVEGELNRPEQNTASLKNKALSKDDLTNRFEKTLDKNKDRALSQKEFKPLNYTDCL